jgi:hypothetical protein
MNRRRRTSIKKTLGSVPPVIQPGQWATELFVGEVDLADPVARRRAKASGGLGDIRPSFDSAPMAPTASPSEYRRHPFIADLRVSATGGIRMGHELLPRRLFRFTDGRDTLLVDLVKVRVAIEGANVALLQAIWPVDVLVFETFSPYEPRPDADDPARSLAHWAFMERSKAWRRWKTNDFASTPGKATGTDSRDI